MCGGEEEKEDLSDTVHTEQAKSRFFHNANMATAHLPYLLQIPALVLQ